jgi:hypothetical protein
LRCIRESLLCGHRVAPQGALQKNESRRAVVEIGATALGMIRGPGGVSPRDVKNPSYGLCSQAANGFDPPEPFDA